MAMVTKAVSVMETILGPGVEVLAKKYGLIKRKRKFSGQSLLQMLVLTLLKNPEASYEDMASTSVQLGVAVSETAVKKRFTPSLVEFLREALSKACQQLVAAAPVNVALLERFNGVFIGDSTIIALPDEFAEEFPGCGGTEGSCKSALKIQVRLDLKTGGLPQVLVEIGKASDSKSPIAHHEPVAGSLNLYDLGYFSLARFRRLNEGNAHFISRLQHGTILYHEDGEELNLREYLSAEGIGNVVDLPIMMGVKDRLGCRLIAVRVPEEVANRRRQKAREKAAKHRRPPSAEYLELLGWSLFVTDLPTEELTWKEAIVLYRGRWQIELLFKLWKSHNRLASHRENAKPEEVMAVLWAKLMGVLLQHWLLLSASWPDDRRSLLKAARALQEWIKTLIGAINDHDKLRLTVVKIQEQLKHVAHIQSRRKRPSHFQLLKNPELLDWGA
jgi:Transposase DDE domain